jgi:CRISPR-associated endonuclease/helicase Cas3
MSELRSHPHLTLAEHLAQIREAARAIWGRHSQTLLGRSRDALGWFEDGVTWHDAGKASAAFQQYIADPTRYQGKRDSKAHTPLSTVLVLRQAQEQGWEWRRALAVALIAAGHHSEFKTHQDLDDAFCTMESVIDSQIRTLNWDALGRAIGQRVPHPSSASGTDLCVAASDYLEELVQCLHEADIEALADYRLRCQLAFSVLLEADKAFLAIPTADLPRYLSPRQADLPPRLVEEFIAGKPAATINPLRQSARREMFQGLEAAGDCRVHTMTLPTGSGKTLLAASWALTLRERITREEGQPPLILVVLPFLAIIDQTAQEYRDLFQGQTGPGDLISYHSLSDRTFAPDLEDQSQDFFLDSWQSDVILTTFDQFLFALLSPKARHQMRFHHLADALVILDEVQALPCVLWDPLRKALAALTQLGRTHVLAMSATPPGFLCNPHELIAAHPEFFRQVGRYRIVLRHHCPVKLGQFARACLARLAGWADKRVLITLNTRRSARRVRDELERSLPDGMPLEFLSADVAPKDRLAAIRRIKHRVQYGEPCLVVSTQCIEAGVDIDMDLVLRDFAPLDSLIQVAGRCNRNGLRPRSIVEILALEDDDTDRSFAAMVYDKILLQATRQLLGNLDAIDEENVLEFTRRYFQNLSEQKDIGEAITRAWLKWEETPSARTLLRGKQPPQVTFLVLANDPALSADLNAVLQIADRWQRRAALRRLAPRLAENSVQVYQREDLDPTDFAGPFPTGKSGEDVWFWLLRDGFYTAQRGLDLQTHGADGDDSWGMLL